MDFKIEENANGDLVISRIGRLDLYETRRLLSEPATALIDILSMAGKDPYDLCLLPEVDYAAIGALTSSPILATEADYNDYGDLVNIGKVYWYPNYMIADPVREILRGECVFDKATDA